MRLLENSLQFVVGTFDDPGDYPNSLAASPLCSKSYVDEVMGSLVFETRDDVQPGIYRCLSEIGGVALDAIVSKLIPTFCCVRSWLVERDGDRLLLSIDDFESDEVDRTIFED